VIWRVISILGVVFALIMASKLDDPRFASVRDWAAPLLITLSLAAAFGLARRRPRIDLATRTGWLIVAGLTGMTICAPYTARTGPPRLDRWGFRQPSQHHRQNASTIARGTG
jgi:hypothetical protein